MGRPSKKQMLTIMKESGWHCPLTKDDPWQDIYDEYQTFKNEDDSTLYPNGRNYDAEDED